jgi:hypothetical protein
MESSWTSGVVEQRDVKQVRRWGREKDGGGEEE